MARAAGGEGGQGLGFAVPQLEDVVVEWEWVTRAPSAAGGQAVGARGAASLKAGSLRATLPCANPACHDGGFEVGFLVESLLLERTDERKGVLVCIGWEEGPGGEAGRPCVETISYRLRLKYRRKPGS